MIAGKRAPTVALCRDPRGYVPIGTNPWRGPPIPYGTPMTNGLNVLPPNKYPYIPPGADPDPVAAQLLVHPIRPIGAAGGLPDVVDVGQQPQVLQNKPKT